MIEAIRQTHGHRLSPAISWVRSHAVALAMCATFVVLRVIAIGSTGVWTDPDSISYFDLRVWRPIRLWTVPLVYSIGFSDGQLVVVQTGLSIGAWIAAAVLIARVFQRRAVVNGALAGVLVIGLTAPVTNWDAALLSESLGLSLSVLLIALGLNVLCRPSKSVVWVTSIVAFLWAFSRQSHAYVLVVVVVALALAALLRRPRRRELAVLACVLGVLTVGAIMVSNSNTSVQRWNLAEIIARRVLTDDSRLDWWRRHGMPEPPPSALQPVLQVPNPPDPVIFTQLHTLLENRRFASWLDRQGSGTYLEFLATHPRYVVTTPLTDRAVLDGFLQGTINTDVRHVLPGVVEDAVWPTRREALLVALFCVALVVFVLSRSRRRRTFALSQGNARALAYAVFLFGLSAIAAFAFAHLVGAEFGRVLLLPALTLRLAVVIGGAALVDALHSPRHPDRLLSA